MYLTEKQRGVYEYIKHFIEVNGQPPSYTEIQTHFGFRSLGTVFDYVKLLERKNFLERGGHQQKRTMRVVDANTASVPLPLVGTVAAGFPIDAHELREYVDVPESMLAGGENVALRIRGDSMVDEGILDGDVVIVRKQQTAENGQIVVALVDGQATIKRIRFEPDSIELRPANPAYEPIRVTPEQSFEVYGTLVGLYRRFP